MNKLKQNRWGKSLLLLAIFALMSGSVWAYDFSAENEGKTIYYNITDDVNLYVEVTHNGSTDSYVGVIVVPQTVEHPDTHVVYTIKGVGAYAFKRNSESGSGGKVTSVTLPETVTYIGDEAFNNGYTFLTSVNIPDAVTSIGSNAFRCCRGLTGSLDLTNVTNIGTSAFYYCTGLTAVSVNADIPSGAFQNCSSLATLTLGNNVTSIGGSAFQSTALAGPLTIPNGVTSIGNSAFANLTGLTALTIGSGLETIGTYAFKGCTGLASISFGTHNFTIGSNAFMNCTGLTDLTLPANLTSVGQSAFQGCSGLENIYFYAANCSFSQSSVWSGCTHACTVTIGNGVAGLPNNAFRGLTGLNSIVWGEHTTFTIGDNAFYGCTGLTTLTIPDFVTSIGSSAFSGCTGITTLTIGTGVSNIGSHAFNGCSSLANIYFNATNCTVGGSGIFGNCTHDCTATIGDNVTSLPDYVFMSHTGLKTINWGTHTTLTIGKNSFSGCSGLTSIAIPDCVTSIGERAFMSCGNVTTLTIGASVTAVGNSAFDGCSKLETVYYNAINCSSLPNNTSSFTSMWNNCNRFSTVVIGNNVTHLPANLFYGTKITTVNFDTDPHLQVIGYGAFQTCYSLTSFTIPNTVTTIGSYAFRSDNSLQTITIGSGVTSIGSNAFMWCSSLETINWNVANAANNITIGDGIWYSINTYPQTLVIGEDVVNLPNSVFSGFSGLTEIWFMGTTQPSIGSNTFSGVPSGIPVYYPKGSSYTWSGFSNYIPFTRFTNASGNNAWNDADNWVYGIPESTDAALINAEVTITNRSTVTVGHIAFEGTGGQVVVEDGGQLNCNSIASTENSQVVIRDGGQLFCQTRANATLEKGIAAWTTDPVGGWYFIASPTATAINPATENGLLTNEYDLYRYDEADKMWKNYKNGLGFPLSNSMGYLYANNTLNTLSFGGTMLGSNEEITIEDLSYACENTYVKGFNLMGNPFTHNLTNGSITLGGEPLTTYYMVENGSEITAVQLSETSIKSGRGFMVQATAECQDLVFNPSAKGNTTKVGYISIAAGNEDFTDKAYIQMGGGNTLQKMTLGDNTPKVYVQQGNEDYAAVTVSALENEMPVAFEAAEDGTYTIAIDVKGLEIDYLHLIDNLTGADVDLLATNEGDARHCVSTYTFEAKTTDFVSRFRLVFNANSGNADGDDETFAYFDGCEWVVSNTGNATLQVIDITGRVLSSETINGSISVSLKETAGVYMLRLVNGDDVKVQKVVVR